ncbi:MAG: glycine cleavage system protein GcvH [Planctomycetota bacterium]
MSRPDDRRYLKSHEWCKNEDGTASIGITDHAVANLSDLVFLDLPSVGSAVTAGESFGEVESVKAVSDLYSPVSGEVIEVNEALPDSLDTLGTDAFGAGWMIKVKVESESPDLLDASAYDKMVEAEG